MPRASWQVCGAGAGSSDTRQRRCLGWHAPGRALPAFQLAYQPLCGPPPYTHTPGVAKGWQVGQRCQAFWADVEAEGGGRWWAGTIVADARHGSPAEALADPFGCGGLWERFTVEWQGEGLAVAGS